MANIKGITIELGGDTTKLDKAIKDVNKTSRNLQAELSQVNKALKFDTDNATLLKQKQELLNDSIKATSEKLKTLKEAEKQVQEQVEKGEISQDVYRQFQRELVETEQKLKGLQTQNTKLGESNSKLNKTFKEIENNNKSLKNELKEVNEALKLDPKNTELLKQKQDLLKESIAGTGKELEILKNKEREMQEQVKNGEVSKETYRKLQREIVKTEQNMEGLKKEFKSFEKNAVQNIDIVAKKMKTTGDTIEKAGSSFTKVSTGVTALGGASVLAYNDVKTGTDAIVKATGATDEKLKSLKTSFENVAGTVSEDFLTIGGTIGEVNTRFGLLGEELDSCTEDFIKFAKINNIDTVESVRNVSRAMGDAGIESSNYKQVLEYLTTASQISGISIDKLTENITKYGAPMRALGLDTKESIAIFTSWEKAGVNTEIAFSGMKQAIGKWGKEGKDATEEFKKSLTELEKCPDIASETAKSIEIFGQKAGPDLADAIKGGRFEYEDFLKIIESSNGIVDSTFGNITDESESFKVAFQEMKISASDLGKAIMSSVAPMLTNLANNIKKVADWFNSLSPTVQNVILILGGIIIVAGPLLMFIGGLISSIGTIIGVMNTLGITAKIITAAQWLWNAAIAANPIMLIVIAITAVIAIIVVMYQKCEWFRDGVNDVFKAIGDFLKGVWEGIKAVWEWIKEGFNNMLIFFAQLPTKIKEKINEIINNITTWAIKMKNKAIQIGSDFLNNTIKFFKEVPTRVKEKINETLNNITT